MTKIYKYSVLRNEMRKKHETLMQVAKLVGITDRGLQYKLDGIHDWTISEIEILCNHYNMNYYELFKKED